MNVYHESVDLQTASPGRALPRFVCPSCSGSMEERNAAWECLRCRRRYPIVAGIPDFRLDSDRYLDLNADREKAERLARIAEEADFRGLIDAYYDMTLDVDSARRSLYSSHIGGAEARGEILAKLLPGDGLTLEIGCGSGGLLAALDRSGRRVVGLDIALRWLVASRSRLADLGRSVDLVGASTDRLPYPAASFDVVVADSVLEHLDNPISAIREWARVLKPGGMLRIWSPNRWSVLRDPHVGLLGVGWLPRAWASTYVRSRRNCEWPIRPLGAIEARNLLDRDRWESVEVEAAAIEESMVEGPLRKAAIRFHERLRRHPVARHFLSSIGPIWQLRATRTEAG